MLGCIFGWSKASKCKKLVKYLQRHLWRLMKRRDWVVRQSREDIVWLLKNGNFQSAFGRLEQLHKDQTALKVYHQLDRFCEVILSNITYIRRKSDCPDDINEAVSSLIFAAPRCGDLPQLQGLRDLFGQKYGKKFAVAAVELYPGNKVNKQISERLSIKTVTDEMKLKLIKDIIQFENIPQLEYQDIENEYKLQQIGYKLLDQQVDSPISITSNCESITEDSDGDIKVVYNDTQEEKSRRAVYFKDLQILDHSRDSVILVDNSANQSNQGSPCPSSSPIVSLQHKMEGVTAAGVSESLRQSLEDDIIYLDDKADLLFPSTPEDSEGEQRRRFILKSTSLQWRCKCRQQHAKNHTLENKLLKSSCFPSPSRGSRACSSTVQHCDSKRRELCNGKSGYRHPNKNKKSHGQTSRKRPSSWHSRSFNDCEDHECAEFFGPNEGYAWGIHDPRDITSMSAKDVEFAWYYNKAIDHLGGPHHLKPKLCRGTKSNGQLGNRRLQHRKHQQQISSEGSESSSFRARKKKPLHPQSSTVAEIYCQECECSNNINGCYCNRRPLESYRCRHNMVHRCYLEHPCCAVASFNGDDGEKCPSFKHQGGGRILGSFSHDVQLDRDKEYTENQGQKKQQSTKTGEGQLSPYLKTKRAPAKQPDITSMKQIPDAESLELQKADHPSTSCCHVHPRLPDYDDLVAKFTALKKEHMQRRVSA